MPSVFAEYLSELNKNLADGDATEGTHRPAIKKLVQALAPGITATNEPKRIKCGAPDFNVTQGKVPIGHIETKDIPHTIGTTLDEMEQGKGSNAEQFKRYSEGLRNWVLTDYVDFRWFVDGKKVLTARLASRNAKGKLVVDEKGEQQLSKLLASFLKHEALEIGTAEELATRLAGMAEIMHDLILESFKEAGVKPWLENWLTAFREILLPDLNQNKFADMFSQTVAYGMFAARVHTYPKKDFSRQTAAYCLPKTNPFLFKLFMELAGPDMPDTFDWAVDEIVAILNRTNIEEVTRHFGEGEGKEDPVVHFYETFLRAYDKELRTIMGVYYTPTAVVGYIVRSIDKLLKSALKRVRGLADEATLVLDAATGTATFLFMVIHLIRQNITGGWNAYVSQHLLKRLFGFEILVAPYAVAHLKLGLQLQESGYEFDSNERLGIYLTNTLEEAAKKSENLIAQWISKEADSAAVIKRDEPILVVLGNPPYFGLSANRSEISEKVPKTKLVNGVAQPVMRHGKQLFVTKKRKTFIGQLIEDYKQVDGKPMGERKHWLQNDYVKFIRFAQWRVEKTGEGIIGFITDNSYLRNVTFRGMRNNLLRCFSDIYIYDLHGNVNTAPTAPDGTPDTGVFDIKQGTALLFCIKRKSGGNGLARLHHAEIWGSREHKFQTLRNTDIEATKWTEITPSEPYYLFVPHDQQYQAEYLKGTSLPAIFGEHSVGCVTARDDLTIGRTSDEIWKRVEKFASLSPEDARSEFKLGKDARDWKVKTAQKDVKATGPTKNHIEQMLFRPFDRRYTYYTGTARGFYASPCSKVMNHMLEEDASGIPPESDLDQKNLGLIASRSVEIAGGRYSYVKKQWQPVGFEHVFCAQDIIQHHSASLKEVNYLFPLYVKPTASPTAKLYKVKRLANLDQVFIANVTKKYALGWVDDGHGDLEQTIGAEDVFDYIYAILHSPSYRQRYGEFLRLDFPHIPFTSDLTLFTSLAAKGNKLMQLHTMQSTELEMKDTESPIHGEGSNEVEMIRYEGNRVWINKDQYFTPVGVAAWEFHVGGYRVCERWLFDRTGQVLTWNEMVHYAKVTRAVQRTVELMDEINDAIPSWPLA